MRPRELIESLTRQQRIALIAVIVMNAVIFIAAFVLLLGDTPPEPVIWPDTGAPCEAYAATSFRQQNVAASVTITREAMLVTIDGPSTQAWDVFSVTARIASSGLRALQPRARGCARSRWATQRPLDLRTHRAGTATWLDGKSSDVQLAERMRRQVYQTAPPVTPTP